jgi:hypothetical protein
VVLATKGGLRKGGGQLDHDLPASAATRSKTSRMACTHSAVRAASWLRLESDVIDHAGLPASSAVRDEFDTRATRFQKREPFSTHPQPLGRFSPNTAR